MSWSLICGHLVTVCVKWIHCGCYAAVSLAYALSESGHPYYSPMWWRCRFTILLQRQLLHCFYLEPCYCTIGNKWSAVLFLPYWFIQWCWDIGCSSLENLRWQLKVRMMPCEPPLLVSLSEISKRFLSVQYHWWDPISYQRRHSPLI